MGVKGGVNAKVLIDIINASSGRNSASEDKFPRAVLTANALPLPLAGEGWGGGAAASHHVERAPTRIASFDAIRPPPQAGEVQRVCRRTGST